MTSEIDNATTTTECSSPKPASKRILPPDPDGVNDNRANWAGAALQTFRQITGTDPEDALSDLLTDLMHWADRNGYQFDAELGRGHGHYQAETEGEAIVIEVKGGCVVDVWNLPDGYRYQVLDRDQFQERDEKPAPTNGGVL